MPQDIECFDVAWRQKAAENLPLYHGTTPVRPAQEMLTMGVPGVTQAPAPLAIGASPQFLATTTGNSGAFTPR